MVEVSQIVGESLTKLTPAQVEALAVELEMVAQALRQALEICLPCPASVELSPLPPQKLAEN
jgi:hypothetical protein